MPYTPYRRKSGIFHIRGVCFGQRVDRSAGTRSEAQAKTIAAKWEADAFEQYVKGPQAVATFAQVAAGYMRSGGDVTGMERLVLQFGRRRLATIDQAALDQFAASALPNGSDSYRRRHIYTPFIAAWNWGVENGLCTQRKWRKPEEPQGRLDWRRPAEVERVLDASGPQLRRAIALLVGSGMRGSEAVELDCADVSPALLRAQLWDTKGGYARSVEFCERVRRELAPMPATGRVLRNEAGEPWAALNSVRQGLERACIRVGIKHMTPHTLRHTWATWRYAQTKDLAGLMAQGGWKSAEMVMRYVHAGSDDIADEARAYGWEFSGKPAGGVAKIVGGSDA